MLIEQLRQERVKILMADLSIKQVAERLDIDERTATRYVANGYFTGAYKLNPFASRRSEWRIPEAAVIAFEEKRRETAKKPLDGSHTNNRAN